MITGKNYIGTTLSAKGTTTYTTFNPQRNKENTTVFTEATPEEINQAVEAASEAFKTYRTVSGSEKATFLNAIADEILALEDELITIYTAESGLPEGRALGERGRTIAQLRMFANVVAEGSWVEATIDPAQPNREPNPRADIRKMLVPIGPVVVFGASNFPLAFSTAGGDTVSALASGCPVIVKSHPMHAGTSELVATAISKAVKKTSMPNGVFSHLNSRGIEVGQQLVQHPKVKAVGFTGSLRGGRALLDIAANRKEPIPVFTEMGSINPVILLPKATQEKAEIWAKTYASSITLGAGQFCTNPGLVIGIKSEGLFKFSATLVSEIVKIAPQCMLHPKIQENYQKLVSQAKTQKHVEIVAALHTNVDENYAQQTIAKVSGKEFIANKTLQEEVFGPFSLLVECENKEELENVLACMNGQLTGTILSEQNELDDFSTVVDILSEKVGRIIHNGVPTGVEVTTAMQHGGPYPASSDSRFTAVGTDAIKRWVRPFAYQDWPNESLPDALKNENPLQIFRKVDQINTKEAL